MLSQITPLILTYNETPNIARTLAMLSWAHEVVVIDSFSTDDTLRILRDLPQTRVLERKFDNHSAQWNFGLDNITTEWVLALDADYLLTDEMISELRALAPPADIDAFFTSFRYCAFGRPLKGTLYPERAVLFRKGRCRYVQDGHTQVLSISGRIGKLAAPIYHDDRKPLSRWLASQEKYAVAEAEKLLTAPVSSLGFADRLRKWIVLAPVLVLIYTLLAKGMIFDGWRGWYYALQRVYAELLLSLHLLEARLNKHS